MFFDKQHELISFLHPFNILCFFSEVIIHFYIHDSTNKHILIDNIIYVYNYSTMTFCDMIIFIYITS